MSSVAGSSNKLSLARFSIKKGPDGAFFTYLKFLAAMSARDRLVSHALRFCTFLAEALLLVGFVFLIVAVEEDGL